MGWRRKRESWPGRVLPGLHRRRSPAYSQGALRPYRPASPEGLSSLVGVDEKAYFPAFQNIRECIDYCTLMQYTALRVECMAQIGQGIANHYTPCGCVCAASVFLWGFRAPVSEDHLPLGKIA